MGEPTGKERGQAHLKVTLIMVAKGRTRAHDCTQGFGHGGHGSRVTEREMKDNQILWGFQVGNRVMGNRFR